METKIINQRQSLNMCKEDKISNRNDNEIFRRYLHEVRNMKTLDKEMINNIRNMSHEDKMDIIIAFNDVVETLKVYLE
jgi:hypothetical protein